MRPHGNVGPRHLTPPPAPHRPSSPLKPPCVAGVCERGRGHGALCTGARVDHSGVLGGPVLLSVAETRAETTKARFTEESFRARWRTAAATPTTLCGVRIAKTTGYESALASRGGIAARMRDEANARTL